MLKREEGQMLFIDALLLVQECLKQDILHYADSEHKYIAIYYMADSEFPEGWYAKSIEDVAHDVMLDKEAQIVLKEQLKEADVEIPVFDLEGWNTMMSCLTGEIK